MASHKFTSFQSYRAGADLTKSVENFGQVYYSQKGSGFNLLGQSTPEPATKILNQLCRGDTVTLGQDSQRGTNQTAEHLKQLLQLNGQHNNLLAQNAQTLLPQDQTQLDELKAEQTNRNNLAVNGDGRAAMKVSQRVEQAESNHQMNHS